MDFRGQDSQRFMHPPPLTAIACPYAEVENMTGNEFHQMKEKIQHLENANGETLQKVMDTINEKFISMEVMLSQTVETLVDALEKLSLSISAEISALKIASENHHKSAEKSSCAVLQHKSKVPEKPAEVETRGLSTAKCPAKSFAELENAVFGSEVIDVSNSESDGASDEEDQDVDGELDEQEAMETEEQPDSVTAPRTSTRVAKKSVKKVQVQKRGRKLGRRNKTESKATLKEKLAKLEAEKEAGLGGFGKPSLSVRDHAQEILNKSQKPINWMTRRCILSYYACLEPEEGLMPIGQKDHILKLLDEEIDDENVKIELLRILNMYS